ncbi:DinB family protein [Paenibacillus sp.]|uniref:DinB family protein n=1 Tax=Paenibacillus sp. TaxID=58172 RepID=UPI002D6968B7|nr:DinB family protein [Paenibacillus sp.]HZG83479.1 DinB family protein [Paenibacillus sp.]
MTNRVLKHFEYHVWANEQLFRGLESLPDAVWTSPVEGSFPTVQATLAHMYAMERTWRYVLSRDRTFEQIAASVPEWLAQAANARAAEVERLFRESADDYRSLLGELPDPDASAEYEHPRLGILRASPAELVAHVVNHGTHHRGGVAQALRQLGHAAPPLDYVYYLYWLQKG